VTIIPLGQAWFYSEKWQKEEQIVEEDIRSNRLQVAESEDTAPWLS